MPFTFSHPAAVLPFTYVSKKYVSFTALVAGSLIPDFEYFIRFSSKSLYSHTVPGLFWFDLPLALLASFIFHGWVRNPLLRNVPSFVKSRCAHCYYFNWWHHFKSKWAVIVVCILLGAASHLLWDHLTHETTGVLSQAPAIQNRSIPAKDTLVYYSFWGINSLLALLALMIAFYKMPLQKGYKFPGGSFWFLPLTGFFAFIISAARVQLSAKITPIDFVDTAIGALFIGLLLAPVFCRRAFRA